MSISYKLFLKKNRDNAAKNKRERETKCEELQGKINIVGKNG